MTLAVPFLSIFLLISGATERSSNVIVVWIARCFVPANELV